MNWYDEKKAQIHRFVLSLNVADRDEWFEHRRACDKSLFYFIREVGGYMPKSGGDISEFPHKIVCDFWQDKSIKRKACYMPRKWRKTTCLTCWGSVWEYLQNNEIRILIPSEKEDKASEWVRWIEQQIIRNERLRWLYPELLFVTRSYTKMNPWSGKNCLLPRQGVYPESTISCIGIRGGAQGGHTDIVNADDLIGERGMESLAILEDAFRYFDNIEGLTVDAEAKTQNKSSIIRLVGTFWALGDLGCYVQANYPEYKWLIVPALKDNALENTASVTWLQNPNVGQDESNWPEVMPTEVYLSMRANQQQEQTFWCQHQNNPYRSTPMNKIERAWIRWFHFEDDEHGEKWVICDDDKEKFRLADIPLYGFIDPGGFAETKPTSKKACRNAIVIGGQPIKSLKKFVVYAVAGKLKEPSKFITNLFDLNDEWRPQAWRIDVHGQQPYIYHDILEAKHTRTGYKHYFNISPLPPDTGKKDIKDLDIQALINPFANGEIYMQRNQTQAIVEVTEYPGGLTVDILDMMAKMNKHYWSRRPKSDLAKLNAMNAENAVAGSGSITGY